MGPEVADRYRDNSRTGLRLPSLTSGAFKVSGASSLIKNQEVISTISKLILPLTDPNGQGKVFLPYLEPMGIIKSIIRRSNLEDEGIMVSAEKAKQISQAQQQQQDAQIQAQQQQEAGQAQEAQAKAHEVGAEGDRHIAQAGAFDATAAATAAGAGAPAGAGEQPPAAAPPGYGGEV